MPTKPTALPAMKLSHLRLALLSLGLLLPWLTQCTTPATSTPAPAQERAAQIVDTRGVSPGHTFRWSGGVNSSGFAHGQGTGTWRDAQGRKTEEFRGTYVHGSRSGPFTSTVYFEGQKHYEMKGTYTDDTLTGDCEVSYQIPYRLDEEHRVIHDRYTNNRYGQPHGHSVSRYEDGGRHESDWVHGNWSRQVTFNPDGSTRLVKTAPATAANSAPIPLTPESHGPGVPAAR